jgi:hypothetical protein
LSLRRAPVPIRVQFKARKLNRGLPKERIVVKKGQKRCLNSAAKNMIVRRLLQKAVDSSHGSSRNSLLFGWFS